VLLVLQMFYWPEKPKRHLSKLNSASVLQFASVADIVVWSQTNEEGSPD